MALRRIYITSLARALLREKRGFLFIERERGVCKRSTGSSALRVGRARNNRKVVDLPPTPPYPTVPIYTCMCVSVLVRGRSLLPPALGRGKIMALRRVESRMHIKRNDFT